MPRSVGLGGRRLTRKPSPTMPQDRGRARRPGLEMPSLLLPSTAGRLIDLSKRDAARTVVYCYSMTGVPGAPLPEGWDLIPGARGCTPQACAFRDHYRELAAFEAELFGLSTQPTDYQREMAERLHLQFEILSDAAFTFANANFPHSRPAECGLSSA